MLNPIASAVIETAVRAAGGGAPSTRRFRRCRRDAVTLPAASGSVAANVVGGLPQVQAVTPPPPSRLFPTRDRRDVVLRLLGSPIRDVSQAQASCYASQGR
jgi:hypothetical protein